MKQVMIEGIAVNLQVWDLVGEEQFRAFAPSHLESASGFTLIYDLTRAPSLYQVDEWLKVLDGKERDISLSLVGGKVNLREHQMVERKDAEEMAKSLNFCDYLECFAKMGENIQEIFEAMARLMVEGARNSREKR